MLSRAVSQQIQAKLDNWGLPSPKNFWRSFYMWVSRRILDSTVNYTVGESSRKGELGIWHQYCNQSNEVRGHMADNLNTSFWWQLLSPSVFMWLWVTSFDTYVHCSLYVLECSPLQKTCNSNNFPQESGIFWMCWLVCFFCCFSSHPLQPVSYVEPI